jgi:hypothetical protein
VWEAPTLEAAIAVIREQAATFEPSAKLGWREVLTMLANGLEDGRPRFTVITTDGNKKLPFAAFSVLPLHTCPGAGPCAAFCYSLKAWQYPGALARQLQNSLLIKFAPDVIESAFMALPNGSTFRLYVDGDFHDSSAVDFWFRVLNQRPDIRAYGYSKSWDLLNGRTFPANYWLNLSSGGRHQHTTAAELGANPQTRGQFIAVEIEYHGRGFKRYQDPAYHRAVVQAAKAARIERPFSCPGTCGTCTRIGPACALVEFIGRNIVIGVH